MHSEWQPGQGAELRHLSQHAGQRREQVQIEENENGDACDAEGVQR